MARLVGVAFELLDGEWKLLCVCHVASRRRSICGGESIEVGDKVSKSGVPGSRYGFVVLMKVTTHGVSAVSTYEARKKLTIPGDVHPHSILAECVLVGVEAF